MLIISGTSERHRQYGTHTHYYRVELGQVFLLFFCRHYSLQRIILMPQSKRVQSSSKQMLGLCHRVRLAHRKQGADNSKSNTPRDFDNYGTVV